VRLPRGDLAAMVATVTGPASSTGELIWTTTPEEKMGRVLELRRASGGKFALVLRSSGRTTVVLSPAQMRSLAASMLSVAGGPGVEE
jgi:hypothetical protein